MSVSRKSQLTNCNNHNMVQIFKAYNVIYPFKCNLGNMEYIGQTSNYLLLHLNIYRSLRKCKKSLFQMSHNIEYSYLYSYFKKRDFNNITTLKNT